MIYLEPDLIEIDLLEELFKFNQLDAQTLINMKLLIKVNSNYKVLYIN